MASTGSAKRPPSCPLESVEKGRKMEHHIEKDSSGTPGLNSGLKAVTVEDIRNMLPGLMQGAMETNMAAMEQRLTTSIVNMTKRLEDKIEATNLSFTEKLETLEAVQEGFSTRLQEYEDRLGNVESISESNSGIRDMVVALAKRIVVLEDYRIKEEENQYLRSRVDELERQVLDHATELRDKRISISGIKDTGNESLKKAVVRTLNQLAAKYDNPTPSQAAKHKAFINEDDIDIAYRTGKKIDTLGGI